MTGFLGTRATLLSDVSLILETIIVGMIALGWWYGRKHRGWSHHWLMLVTVVVDVGFLAVYMLRRVLEPTVLFPKHDTFFFAVYLPVVMVHSIISSVAFVLGIVLTVKGIRQGTSGKGRRTYGLSKEYAPKHHRMGVWAVWSYLASGLSGIAVYYMLYMM